MPHIDCTILRTSSPSTCKDPQLQCRGASQSAEGATRLALIVIVFIIHWNQSIIVSIIISLYLMLLSVRSFQGLTFKIGNVKRMSPASKAGLSKMDYLISVTNDGFVILLHYKDSLDFNLNLDQRTSSVQYDPRWDGQRDQEFRRHSSLGVWEVDTLASCFPRVAIISQQDCNAKKKSLNKGYFKFKQRVL